MGSESTKEPLWEKCGHAVEDKDKEDWYKYWVSGNEREYSSWLKRKC